MNSFYINVFSQLLFIYALDEFAYCRYIEGKFHMNFSVLLLTIIEGESQPLLAEFTAELLQCDNEFKSKEEEIQPSLVEFIAEVLQCYSEFKKKKRKVSHR